MIKNLMKRNALKEKMKNGKVVIGTLIPVPCPELVELAGFIEFDYRFRE